MKIEWNDLRCIIAVLNAVLIIFFGVSITWFGFSIALLGIVKDLTVDKKVNGLILHSSTALLNFCFIVKII